MDIFGERGDEYKRYDSATVCITVATELVISNNRRRLLAARSSLGLQRELVSESGQSVIHVIPAEFFLKLRNGSVGVDQQKLHIGNRSEIL